MSGKDSKVAIVTGGSRGIGRAIAERLARDGAAVAIAYAENRERAEAAVAAVEEAGGRAIAVQADVSGPDDVRRLFEETEARLGPPDIVVANAGNFVGRPFAEATVEDYERGFSVNARGTFLTFAEAARRVADGGRIIGLSSSLVVQGRAGLGLYTASKATVEQFVRILAKELGPRQITVNAVSPGPTDTEMLSPTGRSTAPQLTPLGRVADPRDVADVVGFLASGQARWVTGQTIQAGGGIV